MILKTVMAWSVYHIGSILGYCIWPQFYGSFGPSCMISHPESPSTQYFRSSVSKTLHLTKILKYWVPRPVWVISIASLFRDAMGLPRVMKQGDEGAKTCPNSRMDEENSAKAAKKASVALSVDTEEGFCLA